MVVVGGLIPTGIIILLTLRGMIVAIPKLSSEGFVMLGILGAHVAILGGLLYLLAAGVARMLCWMLSKGYAVMVAMILVAALIALSCFDIYRLPSHHVARPANLVEVFRAFAY
jgi:predicted lipid-binding transport protein (Tim44 family)